jgi:hypothetical protein
MLTFLRSRMFTPAFKVFSALAVFGFVGAFTLAFTSGQSLLNAVLGPVTFGWKGGVGNHFTYTVLVSLGVVSAVLAVLHIVFRDADAEAEAQVVHTDSVPLTRAPTGTNFLPLMAAFAVAVVVIGQVTNQYVTLAGLGLVVLVMGVWVLRAWAERATGDDEVNREIYQRFIEPFRVPVLAAVSIAVVVVGLSRVLLAVSEVASVAVFGVVGALFLLGAALLAARPQISKNAITILLFVGAIAVIAAGIIAAVQGQRDIEHHGDEHSTETEAGTAEGGATEGGSTDGDESEEGMSAGGGDEVTSSVVEVTLRGGA